MSLLVQRVGQCNVRLDWGKQSSCECTWSSYSFMKLPNMNQSSLWCWLFYAIHYVLLLAQWITGYLWWPLVLIVLWSCRSTAAWQGLYRLLSLSPYIMTETNTAMKQFTFKWMKLHAQLTHQLIHQMLILAQCTAVKMQVSGMRRAIMAMRCFRRFISSNDIHLRQACPTSSLLQWCISIKTFTICHS